mmetsp:Transcript_45280/g.120410  ORF Transcript_45280/g.120410 Transcript_45280/m.120410 type:complete len:355 (-) Transcript_45280:211-1275(-)
MGSDSEPDSSPSEGLADSDDSDEDERVSENLKRPSLQLPGTSNWAGNRGNCSTFTQKNLTWSFLLVLPFTMRSATRSNTRTAGCDDSCPPPRRAPPRPTCISLLSRTSKTKHTPLPERHASTKPLSPVSPLMRATRSRPLGGGGLEVSAARVVERVAMEMAVSSASASSLPLKGRSLVGSPRVVSSTAGSPLSLNLAASGCDGASATTCPNLAVLSSSCFLSVSSTLTSGASCGANSSTTLRLLFAASSKNPRKLSAVTSSSGGGGLGGGGGCPPPKLKPPPPKGPPPPPPKPKGPPSSSAKRTAAKWAAPVELLLLALLLLLGIVKACLVIVTPLFRVRKCLVRLTDFHENSI